MTELKEPRVFLLLHGWENFRPHGHWQRWLAEELLTRGELVMYPQMPSAEHPDLDAWLAVLDSTLARLHGTRVTIVCHSLACALWLRFSEGRAVPSAVERVLLVSVPSPAVLSETEVQRFVEGARRIRPDGPDLQIIASDNDPYCPEGVREAYDIDGPVPVHLVPGAGHITGETGYGPWPDMLRLLDTATAAPT